MSRAESISALTARVEEFVRSINVSMITWKEMEQMEEIVTKEREEMVLRFLFSI
jgi:hypothetical protein